MFLYVQSAIIPQKLQEDAKVVSMVVTIALIQHFAIAVMKGIYLVITNALNNAHKPSHISMVLHA